MDYKIIDKTSYKLHLIKTSKFRTTTIRVILKDELKKENITKRNVLADLITYSTYNYKTRKELVEKCQDLYSVQLYTRDYRIGNYNTINITMSFLNEKFTEPGMEEESIKLLGEILFNLNVKDEKFDYDSFNFIKRSNEQVIGTIKEDPVKYSAIRMLEEMGPNEPFSYHEFGYIDDLNQIDNENIYEYYQDVISKSIVDIYVIGDYDSIEMESYFHKYMKFKTFKREKKNLIIEHSKYLKTPKIIKEDFDSNQSKLTIGCKIKNLTERERNYVLSLYNIILGSSPKSKFFKNIREKHSLCYYISSSLNKLDNILLIRSGISNKNFDKITSLIKKEMKDIEKGNFTDEDLEDAKNIYITRMNEILDNQDAIIDTFIASDTFNLGTIDERCEEIKTITKDEIIKLSKKVKMDTIFLLEGNLEYE